MVDDAAFDHHRCIRQKSAAPWIVAQDRFVKSDHRNALRIVLIAHRMANLLRRLGADKRQVIAQQRIRFFTIFFAAVTAATISCSLCTALPPL